MGSSVSKTGFNIRTWCLTALLLCFAGSLLAEADSTVLWKDDSWEKAKNGIEYTQKEKKEKKEETEIVEEITYDDWNFDWVKSPLTKFVVIIVVLIILSVTIVYLLRGTGKGPDRKITEEMSFDLIRLEEDVPESDFDRFLRLCLDRGDFKTAVRVLYLQLLQQMHHAQWIAWKKNKTNREFLNEVRGRQHYKVFRDLTLAYEIVWYGEQPVNAAQYKGLEEAFHSLKEKVQYEKEQ